MTKEIIDMAQECGLIGMRPHLDGIYSEALVAFAKLVAEKALAEHAMQEVQRLGQEIEQEPVAWMFQHDETGRMNYVSNDGIHNPTMFLEMNPRYALVCPLYTSPPQRTEQEPVAYYLPHKGFYWAKPTSISAPTIADVEPLPLYTHPPKETT